MIEDLTASCVDLATTLSGERWRDVVRDWRFVGKLGMCTFCLLEALILGISIFRIRPLGIPSGVYVVAAIAGLAVVTLFASATMGVMLCLARKPRFHLSTFMLWLTAYAIGLAAFCNESTRAKRLHDISSSLEVGYDDWLWSEQLSGGGLTIQALRFLVGVLGSDFFRDEVDVTISKRSDVLLASKLPEIHYIYSFPYGYQMSDDDVQILRQLKKLHTIHMGRSVITSKGAAALSEIPSLEWLDLDSDLVSDDAGIGLAKSRSLRNLRMRNCDVGDQFVRNITALSELHTLEISRAGISDEGINCLPRFRKLSRLFLDHTCVGDESATTFHRLESLEELSLRGTCITDKGAALISRCTRLRKLDLRETSVSDKGIASLADLTLLEDVLLDDTDITDAGLRTLERFPSLKTVHLSSRGVSSMALQRLKQRPELMVFIDNTWPL